MNGDVDFRCDCTKKPLLGVLKLDGQGHPVLHVKSWRGQQPIVEIEVRGEMRIRCRICLRWHQLNPRRAVATDL